MKKNKLIMIGFTVLAVGVIVGLIVISSMNVKCERTINHESEHGVAIITVNYKESKITKKSDLSWSIDFTANQENWGASEYRREIVKVDENNIKVVYRLLNNYGDLLDDYTVNVNIEGYCN